ncbi:MAG: hypothetical protein RBR68_16190 [Tenuifilaceae bacterium]|nr:hypothetical protein [Tenuifilaceae bacterium]
MKDLAEKIPDVWFDWFARLIPGCIGIILYFLIIEKNYELMFENFIPFLFLGYIIGHIIQPIASGLINYWNKGVQKRKNIIISKAYAELVGFASLVIISVLLLIVKFAKDYELNISELISNDYFIIIVIILLSGGLLFLRKKAFLRKLSQKDDQQ